MNIVDFPPVTDVEIGRRSPYSVNPVAHAVSAN
jgi:hypothetical protein